MNEQQGFEVVRRGVEVAAPRAHRGTCTRRTLLAASLGATAAAVLDPLSAGAAVPPADGARTALLARFGAYVPDPYWDWTGWPAALNAFEARLGRAPSVLHWFCAWGGEQPFSAATARKIVNRGALPLLTWEPWDWSLGATQSKYRLAQITAGAFDAYIRTFATAVKGFASPLYLRFAPEMNGDWNPWSEKVNGNKAGDYVRAWNHVRAVFTSVGATNARWVWTPIVSYSGSTPLAGLFPGNSAVDAVGVDGYNWGTTKPTHGWQTYTQIFGPTLTQLRTLSTKPIWLAEIGCTEHGGSKATWVRDMFNRVAADTRIEALVWFNANKETDWRINSSATSLTAFQQSLATLDFR